MATSSATDELRALLSAPPPPTPPNDAAATTDPRQLAFLALQRLRDGGDPQFLFLRTLIELTAKSGVSSSDINTSTPTSTTTTATAMNASDEELCFHCVGGLRYVMLHKWLTYAADFRDTTRDWLVTLGLCGDGRVIPRTVANACLGCAASLWKRGWLSSSNNGGSGSNSDGGVSGEQKGAVMVENAEAQAHLVGMMMSHAQHRPSRVASQGELFQLAESLMSRPFASAAGGGGAFNDTSTVYTATQASALLINLLGEIGGTSNSGAYNLPLEAHRRIHSDFEAVSNGLDATLHLSMTCLGGAVRTLTDARTNQQDIGEGMIGLCASIVALTVETLSWEFGAGSSRSSFVLGEGRGGGAATVIRPPERWRESIVRPDFLGAVFTVYTAVRDKADGKNKELSHKIRQLLLILSSVSGIIYENREQRQAYAGFLVDGCLNVLALLHQEAIGDGSTYDESLAETETVDLCGMVARIVATFHIEGLCELPSFGNLLGAVAAVGNDLLQKSLSECERAKGDIDDMEGIEWRREALSHLLDAAVLLADDPWLLGGGGDAARASEAALATYLSPLYGTYISVRTRMASLEEHYATLNSEDLDEIREEISEVAAEEEMVAASSLGRLNVPAAVASLSALLNDCLPRLKTLFEAAIGSVSTPEGGISPDAAALLEEARLLVVCITHLLTDDNVGEAPMIPEAIIRASRPDDKNSDSTVAAVGLVVTSLMQLAEYQASMVAANTSDPRLSPLLSKTMLWFFNRWAPAYILATSLEYGRDGQSHSRIVGAWSSQESASSAINFCSTLCLHYHCYWPQEKQVQEAASLLSLNLAKRGTTMRSVMIKCSSLAKLAAMHTFTASLCHNCASTEVAAATANAHAAGRDLSEDMVRGYCRLPYADRANILTGLLVASSDVGEQGGGSMFNEGCLLPVQNSFSSLVQAIHSKQIQAHNVNAKEMTCLCIELYRGIAKASDIPDIERIPRFITPSLQALSDLMVHYVDDLTICELLLRFFRDYAERFISVLDRDQCLALFHASSSLLKSYSGHHCKSRAVVKIAASRLEEDLEEEQSYSDILCAISLLIHLGTKDFIDICSTTNASTMGSNQVTDMIFFGLQQILPLMSQGLLQFPALCTNYFSLVGFMMDTYPDKVCALPFDLFNPLLESMLFGMSHNDTFVAKSSLRGIAGLAREHLKSKALSIHLAQHADIVDKCSTRLLHEVVFQPIIWDRLEPAGMALLPLATIDMGRFGVVVTTLSSQFGSAENIQRFQAAFQSLMQPQVVQKVASGGYEGRMNRLKFKAAFEEFVKEVHSFLVLT
mmetsp:Transcript_839/g.1941  ORF Transcript_839/g.1941 Transcript_839/m.1941 type:complete len:1304 (-) Transcript_839:31-3942(-)